jgi:hypothetical protein
LHDEDALNVGRDQLVYDQTINTHYLTGKISVNKGDTFTVRLMNEGGRNDFWAVYWNEPEIDDMNLVEIIDYQRIPWEEDNTEPQIWTFQAIEKGTCVIFFTAGHRGGNVAGWEYTLTLTVF